MNDKSIGQMAEMSGMRSLFSVAKVELGKMILVEARTFCRQCARPITIILPLSSLTLTKQFSRCCFVIDTC